MKLTNNRLYLDYNATAPLDETVLQWLSKGAFPFGNPSSIHNSGKMSKRLINQTRDYLYETFGLSEHQLFFHSGATEGINDIFKGFAYKSMSLGSPFHIVVFSSDHSCLVNQREHIELMGGHFHQIDVDDKGSFDRELLIEKINELEGRVLLNYTYINNETGVVWPLEDALEIKQETDCFIHVDSVQLIGKWNSLSLFPALDAYTFSGHKFGALKGVGFSFVTPENDFFCSLMRGGGQQEALRSGTENVMGIYSLKLALESLISDYNYELVQKEKESLEMRLLANYPGKIEIVGQNSTRNANTTYMIINGAKTDILITAFDMKRIDISSGSACSSGTIKPSRVLLSMGYSEEQAKSSLRLSFSPFVKEGDGEEIFNKINPVFDKFLN